MPRATSDLMTFSRGTFFGEMALLDRERRSAVTADEMLVCYVLERSSFDQLRPRIRARDWRCSRGFARELSGACARQPHPLEARRRCPSTRSTGSPA
jgi:CRP-like cAMP-binding protein